MTGLNQIHGMACRVPGASTLSELWDLLAAGACVADREPGPRPLRHPGGYLPDVADFDAAAFGMNEREAAAADPQQRLLLETAWQAIADAGIAPSVLQQSRVGVFVGCCADDYAMLSAQSGKGGSPYALIGTSRTMLANRVSYHFGFTGPSLTVDTGQSSSLSALHLARMSLDCGECDIALVAGVHLNLHPFREDAMDAIGVLSDAGVCRPLDQDADGTVRGEGCVAVVMSRLDSALPAYAELATTSAGHDGRSGGLTEPNPAAQTRLVKDALAVAGLSADDLQYAELHGTGTPVGDHVEARALSEALDLPARDVPLSVGSVKASIGHLEGAAGLAGLVKVALMLHHQRVVATPGRRTPATTDLGLSVTTETVQCSLEHASVASFGIGGSNVYAVLSRAQPPGSPSAATGPAEHLAVVVGGHDEVSARSRAGHLAQHLTSADHAAPITAGLQVTEQHFPLRYGLPVQGSHCVTEALQAFARGDATPHPVSGAGEPLVMCFPGQGTQRHRMAMDLYEQDPVFAGDFDQVEDVISPLLGDSVRRLLLDPEADLGRYDVCQAVIFTVEVALARQIQRWGAAPAFVLGHSLGEISAVHVAGHLDLQDAAVLVVERGRLMQTVAADGAMASVVGDLSQIDTDRLCESLDVAAWNSPTSLVISGHRTQVKAACEELDQLPGVRTKPLTSGGASHSTLMSPVAQELGAVARSLRWRSAPTGAPAVISAMTGELIEPTSDHWQQHLRQPVRYADAVTRSHELGGRLYVEVGPGRTLTTLNREILRGTDSVTLPTLWGPGLTATTHAYADLAAAGHLRPRAARISRPPERTFNRSPYWLEDQVAHGDHPTRAAPAVDPQPPATPTAPAGAEVADLIRSSLTRLVHAPAEAFDDPFTSFADLGLDSLAAISLTAELSQTLGRRISASALYDFPSPAALASALETGEDL